MKPRNIALAALAVCAIFSTAQAGTWSAIGTPGNPFTAPAFTTDATSLWTNLSSSVYSGYPGFPGTGSWTSPLSPNSTSGATTNADVDKFANGFFGGAFPSSQGLYFGGFSYIPNTYGGEVGVEETAPVSNVNTVSVQIQTGEAYGWDFYSGDEPVLTYTTASGSYTIDPLPNVGGLVDSWDNGEYEHEEGEEDPQDIIINTYYYQWSIPSTNGAVLSFEVTWEQAQHSQLYGVRLDQAD